MVRRSIEIVAGQWAGITGLALLAYLYSLSFSGDGWSPFGQPPHMTGLIALWGYAATLALIPLGVILHGLPVIVGAGRSARMTTAWVGRLALWVATACLLVLVVLSLPSIGLLFIPSLVLALVACVSSLIPSPTALARA